MGKDVMISFRTNGKLRDALKRRAKDEKRSLSSLIEVILYQKMAEFPVVKASDRRGYPRKRDVMPVIIRAGNGNGKIIEGGTITNISFGGVRINMPKELGHHLVEEEGDKNFDILFTLPDEAKPVSLKCVLKNVAEEEDGLVVGASFLQPDSPSCQSVQRHLM
ncbi:MAG: PilZ domain-containing protein [Desulfoplanes sp.]